METLVILRIFVTVRYPVNIFNINKNIVILELLVLCFCFLEM
jgi:hypothetical protein